MYLELSYVNVFSKVDMLEDKMVLDLYFILDYIVLVDEFDERMDLKYCKFNCVIVSVMEDFFLILFVSLDIFDEDSL